jgi:hypothetical protein
MKLGNLVVEPTQVIAIEWIPMLKDHGYSAVIYFKRRDEPITARAVTREERDAMDAYLAGIGAA